MPTNKGYTSPRPFRGAALAPSRWFRKLRVFRPRQQPKLRYIRMMVLGAEFDSVVQMVFFGRPQYTKKIRCPIVCIFICHPLFGGGFSPKMCEDSDANTNEILCTDLLFFFLT
jgi:hypothetical protein